ncbi:MAG: hypothetical protein KGL39_54025 [Patescibacteria group bacterium]|nr:hypothetical protein [Patescibacteria group bacterium]
MSEESKTTETRMDISADNSRKLDESGCTMTIRLLFILLFLALLSGCANPATSVVVNPALVPPATTSAVTHTNNWAQPPVSRYLAFSTIPSNCVAQIAVGVTPDGPFKVETLTTNLWRFGQPECYEAGVRFLDTNSGLASAWVNLAGNGKVYQPRK